MTDIDRRHLIGALAAGSAVLAGTLPVMAANPELKLTDLKKDTDVACLYHCDFGDDRRYDAMLRNINNHLSAHDFDPLGVKIVVSVSASLIAAELTYRLFEQRFLAAWRRGGGQRQSETVAPVGAETR